MLGSIDSIVTTNDFQKWLPWDHYQ